ncbi:hypothetical protein CVIRNUC_009692 [Coccomyxa viridis]|uniref:Cysteine-rich transmembrane CYSTM domain-containing protein n=1 Tax=Coccomyxa viridis TaxID=1274662 RepID=A0AAV1IGM5_9CHLO|nr:hypothetical protein CVIRNUC_009692 [Coccomyxa viridis]
MTYSRSSEDQGGKLHRPLSESRAMTGPTGAYYPEVYTPYHNVQKPDDIATRPPVKEIPVSPSQPAWPPPPPPPYPAHTSQPPQYAYAYPPNVRIREPTSEERSFCMGCLAALAAIACCFCIL